MESKIGVCGQITDWKSRPTHAFGFIETQDMTYYCSVHELPADMNANQEQLPIDVTFHSKTKAKVREQCGGNQCEVGVNRMHVF
jgi:hypothetical protein